MLYVYVRIANAHSSGSLTVCGVNQMLPSIEVFCSDTPLSELKLGGVNI